MAVVDEAADGVVPGMSGWSIILDGFRASDEPTPQLVADLSLIHI